MITLNFSQIMTNSFSPTLQNSKSTLFELIAKEQDESYIENFIYILKNHSSWDSEILKSIEKGKKDISEGRVTSLEDARKLAKTWKK